MTLVSAVASATGSRVGVVRPVAGVAGPDGAPARGPGFTFETRATHFRRGTAPETRSASAQLASWLAGVLDWQEGREIASLEDLAFDGGGGPPSGGRVVVEILTGEVDPRLGGVGSDRDERINLRFWIGADERSSMGGADEAFSRIEAARVALIGADEEAL